MIDRPNLLVSKFMVKNLVSVAHGTTISDTAKNLYENHVGAATVFKDDKMVGIVTYRDIATSVTLFAKEMNMPISEIMSSPVIHVTPDESIIKVAEIMESKNIRRLPILDQGKVVGIISTTDLAILFSMCYEDDLRKIFTAYLS